ncbi:MAG: hypothetical protein A2Y28_00860 [Chlamydiae bacterium GWC2_50_10]|nr:MAG: hypothetical protein A2Z85_01185 [Chlamydiae bacterium GWA2_50_15]OGN53773.1 MAG: hypothetical protein A2Y28_00860 [Chlamydiae bacterium GWC2_50_10]OGN62619.1 MAG: hypothetical protein A3E26_00680 [Chlamydiae bacterium RIFCSPHIGHO2_12_FULL_49_32]HAZ15556.1 V-type ATP synthase subunit I [Parachlamydiales bacterium]HCJ83826.1 V-type ATP synthase subunit I [Parachlamydiales bacterium]
MIIDLYKFLFVGAREEVNLFFNRAQELGIIQFISHAVKKAAPLPPNLAGILEAIKLLRKQPLKKEFEGAYVRDEGERAIDRILELKKEIERVEEESLFLESEIERVEPLGDFSMEDLACLEKEGKREVQFFLIKSEKREKMRLSEELIYLTADSGLDYFITINQKRRAFPSMIEVHVEKTAPELRERLEFVKEIHHELVSELKGFAGHISYLRRYLIDELNDHHLHLAKKGVDFPLDHSLFSIEGWVPSNKLSELEVLLKDRPLFVEKVAIEKSDSLPTYMENRGMNRIGEDIVTLYDIPSSEDQDPSFWIFWSFALFFAIIVSDAGYGLLYLALAAYMKYRSPRMAGKRRRLYRLVLVLATACTLWGVATGSFFGIELHPRNPLSKISITQYLAEKKAAYHLLRRDAVYKEWVQKIPAVEAAKTPQEFLEKGIVVIEGKEKYLILDTFKDNFLLEFSLFIGVLHLGLSLLRYLKRNLSHLGWFFALIGGYLYVPLYLKATSFIHFLGIVQKETIELFGLQLFLGGVGLAVVLALIQKRFRGSTEILTLVQLFADVLSYLRLYALGLAGAMMAKTANDLGAKVGLFFGFIVILAGHAINIALGIMSGVIHGLRLNFIEWYHYSYTGGGKLFNPLKKLTMKEGE